MIDLKIFNRRLCFLARYGLVSLLCASTEYLSFVGLYLHMKLNLNLSYILSFLLATGVGFVFHSLFTFKLGFLTRRNAFFFIFQVTLVLIVGLSMVTLLIDNGIEAKLAKLMQLVTTFFINVVLSKRVTFKEVRR